MPAHRLLKKKKTIKNVNKSMKGQMQAIRKVTEI